jgi:hypothetical protein
VTRSLLRKLLIGAQEGDQYKAELLVTDSAFTVFKERSVLRNWQDSLGILALRYDSIQQRAVRASQEGAIDNLYKVIKNQKRKTVLVGIAGILATAGALYIGLK